MVLIDMEKPLTCEECRFCEYEQGHCTALPVGEWRRITDMSECPLTERKTGKWIRFVGHPSKWICSNCGRNRLGQQFYCEWCGAQMEFTKW